MIRPTDLRPGDNIMIKGLRDDRRSKSSQLKDRQIIRKATFIRCLPCGYELRFEHGYTEHWCYRNLLYALNGLDVPTVYAPGDMEPEKYIHYMKTGGRTGWREEL